MSLLVSIDNSDPNCFDLFDNNTMISMYGGSNYAKIKPMAYDVQVKMGG